MKLFSQPKSLRLGIISRIAVLCFLLALVGMGAVPGYLSGKWHWASPPPLTNIKQLKQLPNKGVEIPGWQTIEQKTVSIGGHKWSAQAMEHDNSKPVLLLLLPQNGNKSQPQVEWVDIDGFEQWQTDSYTTLNFTVESSGLQNSAVASKSAAPTADVKARFFRAWNQQQTVVVVQWYAWPRGGHPAPSRWFWVDQLAQLRRSRVPWVAVCLQIPIEPLGDLEAARPSAESLGQLVQTALMVGPFAKL
jgi:cyanoexosortase B-associated protein